MNPSFDKPCFVELPARGLINISGDDATRFLQGLISNDINLLDQSPLLYACLLTPQGKFLHDFFISRTGNGYLVETEGADRAQDLLRRLTIYKLRSKVTLDLLPDAPIYVTFGAAQGLPDPRHSDLGSRALTKPDVPQVPFAMWDELRIGLGIADGSRDAELEKSTLEELNLSDTAVSFTKGCYVGQELTARMEHRNLGKKHLRALGFKDTAPAHGTALMISNQLIGDMRSSCGKRGLALVRDDALDLLKAQQHDSEIHLLGQ